MMHFHYSYHSKRHFPPRSYDLILFPSCSSRAYLLSLTHSGPFSLASPPQTHQPTLALAVASAQNVHSLGYTQLCRYQPSALSVKQTILFQKRWTSFCFWVPPRLFYQRPDTRSSPISDAGTECLTEILRSPVISSCFSESNFCCPVIRRQK